MSWLGVLVGCPGRVFWSDVRVGCPGWVSGLGARVECPGWVSRSGVPIGKKIRSEKCCFGKKSSLEICLRKNVALKKVFWKKVAEPIFLLLCSFPELKACKKFKNSPNYLDISGNAWNSHNCLGNPEIP